jgi:hypothetical protein
MHWNRSDPIDGCAVVEVERTAEIGECLNRAFPNHTPRVWIRSNCGALCVRYKEFRYDPERLGMAIVLEAVYRSEEFDRSGECTQLPDGVEAIPAFWRMGECRAYAGAQMRRAREELKLVGIPHERVSGFVKDAEELLRRLIRQHGWGSVELKAEKDRIVECWRRAKPPQPKLIGNEGV